MRFEIVKGNSYTATFVIKHNGTTTALELDPEDTATFTISTADVLPKKIIVDKPLEMTDALNGEFTLTLDPEETLLLESKKSLEEDRFVSMVSHKGVLTVNTKKQGRMDAIINEIYVLDQGE